MRTKIEMLDNLMWLKERYLVAGVVERKEIGVKVDVLEWILKGKPIGF